MKKNISFLFVFVASMMFPVTASAQVAAITDFCVLGAAQAVTSGLQSSNYQQELIPGCTVKVYSTGTTNLATIYADALETPLTNPFTAGTNGQWIFFAAINLGYDIVLSGGISPNIYPAPVTLTGLYPSSELSSTVWGGITGTLSNQTDLQNALNAKLNLSGGTMTGNLILPGITITSLTGYLYANGSSAVTASTTIPVAALTYDSIAVNSQTCTLGSSCTVTADTPNSLTFNNGGSGGASGSTFNGASALTVSYNTVGAAASNASTTVNGQTCTLGSSCTVTAAATSITVGTTTVSSGTTGYILYDNGGTLGDLATTGSGNVVQATSPSIAGLTVTSSFTATGLVTNADLAYDSTAVNGQTCTLGSSCTVTAAATSITVGTTTVSSGTTGYILYDNGGTLGDLATSGSGNVVLATSPSIAGLTVISSFTATGLVTNADLAYDSTAVNSQTCTLGSSCTVTADTPNSLTFNNGGSGGASGSTFNGASALTVSYNTVGAAASNASTTVNGFTCTLGSSCTVSIMNHPFWFDDESDTVYTASQAVVYITSTLAQTIPSGGSSTELGIACTSKFTLKTAATASTTFNINDNGTGFGTIVFGASGTSGTITISSAKSIASGDVITVTGPSTADSTAAGLYGGLCSYY